MKDCGSRVCLFHAWCLWGQAAKPVDCARLEDYFDRLNEPTGCTLISWRLHGRGSQEGIR
jgi:hypothetical protein